MRFKGRRLCAILSPASTLKMPKRLILGSLLLGCLSLGWASFSEYRTEDPGFSMRFQYPKGWKIQREEGRIERYQLVRVLGPRNSEGSYSCYLSIVGMPLKPGGGKFESLGEFIQDYREHLPSGTTLEQEGKAKVGGGQEAVDLTFSYVVPPLHKPGLKPLEIPVRSRILLFQKGTLLYRITYSADAREYDRHAGAMEKLIQSLRFK